VTSDEFELIVSAAEGPHLAADLVQPLGDDLLIVVESCRPTYRRSAAGARATAEPARRLRLLRRFVSRTGHGLAVNSNDADSLVSELGDEFKRSTDGFDVTTERCNLAVLEIGTSLEARDISLIDLGLLSDVDLGFPAGITQGSQGQVDAFRGAKTSPKHSDRLDIGGSPSLS
jgi:hypothetical protein